MTDSPDCERLLASAARTIERRDAEILLAAVAKVSRAQLLAGAGQPLSAGTIERFDALCSRRAAGEPVAYLLGRREFWSLEFEVTTAVLVPRPETELLVERLLEVVPARRAVVADLGTGSGAIAIALAVERPAWRIVATEVSDEALTVARRNGARLAPQRIEWLLNDSRENWYAPLAGRRLDAIASNPPYVAADDAALAGDGLRHEPRTALTPGGDGFAALDTLINGAAAHLVPGGWIALEHGAAQGERARAALVARGFRHVTSHRDLAGHERVTIAQLP